MAEMCLTPSEGIQKLTDKILQKYPEECKRSWFDVKRCTTWVETYNEDNNKPVDFVPGVEELVNNAEKHLNMVGKSFLHELPTITYTPTGKTQQTYTIIGTHIFNKNGEEVFPTDSKDRRKIFANLAVQQGRAVVVTYKDKKYVVNNRNQIISVTSGDEMKWGEENGDRREILRLAQIAFREKEKAATTTVTQNEASDGSDNTISSQLIDHLKSIGINVFNRAQMEQYLKEHPNTLLQQALEEQWEMQDIKAKAIADGTFMKAPNGNPTNLSERQWLQVRTKNFINWFGDWINDSAHASKVVDENGEPLVVYRGGNIKDGKLETRLGGYYFTPAKGYADTYRDLEGGETHSFFINAKSINSPKSSSVVIRSDGKKVPFRGLFEMPFYEKDIDIVLDGKEAAYSQGEYLVKNPNQIKSATDNNGMFSTENDDIQMAIGWNTSLDDVLSEYPTLDYDLTKFNSQAMEYGHTKNGVGYVIYNGNYVLYSVDKDGMARPVIELSGTNKTLKILEDEFKETDNPRDLVRRIDETWNNRQRALESNPSYVRNRKQYGWNDSQNRGQGGLRRKDGFERSSQNSNITQEFITSQGEIYGFVDKEGNMYLDETIIDASHPIHEYTHLWDRALAKNNPELWKRGVKLMQEGVSGLWNEIANSDNYGKLWQSKGIKGYKLVNLIASEVHARLVGDNGAKLLDQIAKEKSNKGIIAKLKQWILDAWKELKATFSNWSQDEIDKLTLKDFNHMTVRDFADGINPNNVQQASAPAFNIANAEFYSGAASGADSVWTSEAKALGISVKDYTGNEYRALSQEWKDKIEKEYTEARQFLGKPTIPIKNADSNMDPGILTRRDMMQADKADAIFAVVEGITKPEEVEDYKGNKYPNNTGHDNVKGGTANAVARGIIRGIPVYVFDQSDSQWKVWDKNSKSFVHTSEPTLTPHAATIGTRGINDAGRQAIKSILTKTVSQQLAQPLSSSSPSPAVDVSTPTNTLAATSMSFSFSEAEMQEAQRKVAAREAAANRPKPQQPKSTAYDSALNAPDSRVAAFNRYFTPQQIKDRGAMIADLFSDIIDEALADEIDNQTEIINSSTTTQEQKDAAKKLRNELQDPDMGRKMMAQNIGIEAIIDQIKQKINTFMKYAAEDKKQLYQNTLDYFTDIFNTQASLDIEEKEKIRIVNLKIEEKTLAEEENYAQDDGDDDTGHIATGSDGWGFQIRFQDPANRLSQVVRSMLYDVTRPDNETDDLGRVRKYPMGQIYASLLAYLSSNMQSPDDFLVVDKTYEGEDIYGYPIDEEHYPNGYPTFPVLEKMRGMYPWVEQIIQRLTDDYLKPEYNTNLHYPSTGGRMASQMYSNFRNAFIPYGKVQVGTGNFGITPLNFQMEDRVQYDKMVANYNNRIILSDTPIYDSNGRINLDNAQKLKNCRYLEVINEVKGILEMKDTNPNEHEKEIAMLNQYLEGASQYIRSFGIESSPQYVEGMLRSNKLEDMLTDLATAARKLTAQVHDDNIGTFNYILDLENSYGRNFWQHFFDGRGWISDDSYMQSYYDSASQKTKYSYSADNYLMQTFRGIALGNLEERRAFIDSHFGKYDWFRDQRKPQGTGWRNAWLEFWYNYTGNSTTIPYMNIDNVTRKDSSGNVEVRPYTKWEPEDIWLVQNRSYAGDTGKEMGFYLAPIFSDSPMSMTVLGPKMSMNELLYGYDDKTGLHYSGAFVNLVFQELSRIKLVQQREQAIKEGRIKPIVNFDGNRGKQFCFIPELNNMRCEENTGKNYPAESFLSRMMRLSTLQEMEATIINAISQIVQNKANAYFTENAEMYESENYPANIEHYYNMMYANAAIIQLTTIDLAFYKDEVDFQKRFKEVYAGGIRLNTNSKYGKKTENVILLADDKITSPSYTHIASIIDGSTTLSDDDKTRIKGYFTDINVADAQATRSMDSFRSVLDMMGRWSDRMEEALNHFKDGTWSREDFDVIYQVIKPFVYSVIERNSGVEGKSPIPVPQQHKNSEICALMMYDLITNGLNNSPVYKALSRFMDNAVDSSGEHLINMCQFESAGKVGNQGVINISFNPNKVIEVIDYGVSVNGHDYEFFTGEVSKNEFLPNDIENAESNYYAIKEQADEKLQNGSMPQEDYDKIIKYLRPTENEIISILEQAVLVTNPDGTKGINTEVVHTIPFDNYYQAQPTPDHSIDTEATFGSQARNISIADLPEDFKITLKGAKGSKVLSGRDAVIDFFYELLNENLLEDFFGRDGKSGLKGLFASKASLRDAITEIVRGNPKYGNEFTEALQLDDNNNFVLSPNSPTIFNLMQELVTSLFKNRITKQTINGAALIQAAGIGLDDELRLRFDKNGKFKGAECYMPLTTRKFFEPLLETQLINDEEVQVLSPKKLHDAGLDEALGYRIPTENKSSMMPLIIKGFTPLQNGSVIVLPAEITTMAGSDFDVDKMFIMLLSFYVQNYNMREARETWARRNNIIKELSQIFYNSDLLDEVSETDPEGFREWFEENKENFRLDEPIIRKVEYDFGDTLNPKSPKDNSRRARNNMLIQMMYGILTSKEGSESVFNPQGFPDVEYSAKVNRIVSDPNMWRKWMDMGFGDTEEEAITALLKSPAKALEKFIKDNSLPESPLYPQTFAHSHAKNMAGSIQIGIYAIQASMCAKYQRASVVLKPNHAFSINNRDITAVYVSEGGKRLKNEGQMVGASADNGKKPNLTDMGSTSRTASIIGYMLNAGLTHLEATLLINQPCMLEAGHSTQTRTAKRVWGKNPLNKLRLKEVTTDMLIKGIVNPVEQSVEDQEAIMAVCYRILKQAEAAEYLTQVSRADSPNGAMQNTYARARIQRYKVDLMQAKMGQRDFPFYKIKEALSNDVIDTSAPEDVIREQLKAQPMAFLYGMYSLGIASFNDLVAPYFFGANKWFDDKIVKPILYNLRERMSDDAKETIISSIYTSYITYILSGSSLFGNEDEASMKSKRDYYLETFPDEYVTIIQENPDIRELLSPILQRKSEGSRNRIVLKDVGNLGKGQKQEIKRRFERLMYMNNPVARDLAEKLFMYSYYDNGLNFSHDSFAHLFTTQFLMGFPIYNNTLRELENEISDADINNFIRQFLVTFPGAAYSVDKFIDPKTQVFNDGDMLIFDLNDMDAASRRELINETMSPNPLSEGENVHSYVSYNYDVYVLDEDAYELSPNRAVYNRLPKYATFSKHPLFSRQMSVAELAQEFSRTPAEEQQQNAPESPSVAPYEENTSDVDPDIQNTMQAAASSMDDFTFDDSILDAPVDKSEKYTNGGKLETQQPLC